MRTNKACPLYTGTGLEGMSTTLDTSPPLSNTTPETMHDSKRKMLFDDSFDDSDRGAAFEDSDELINVDGIKIKLSSKVMKVGPK